MSKNSHIYNQAWSLCIILVSSFHLSCSAASAQHAGVNWTKDLAGALAKAKQTKKLICIDVYTDW